MRFSKKHEPVLKEEILKYLAVEGEGKIFVDCTIGAGGHTEAIFRAAAKDARVIGLDIDEEAIAEAEKNLKNYLKNDRLVFVNKNFKDFSEVLDEMNIKEISGVVADLGVSSMQIENPERGFSFMHDGPLDMRMGKSQEETAEHIVNTYSERALEDVISKFGEETFARKIAREIVSVREKSPIKRTSELVNIIGSVKPRGQGEKIHFATKTFQALRIAVNKELDGLDKWIERCAARLQKGGRLIIISFHSLEDRIVKHAFQYLEKKCVCPPRLPKCTCGKEQLAKVLTRHPVTPSADEVEKNPRSRSAKLRAIERV